MDIGGRSSIYNALCLGLLNSSIVVWQLAVKYPVPHPQSEVDRRETGGGNPPFENGIIWIEIAEIISNDWISFISS